MRFSDILGHDEEKKKLRSMADRGRIPHALLLHGPQGIGKTQLARAFIQYINCKNRKDGDSCGTCPACRQTQALNNPDVHYVYPILRKTSPKRTLSADYFDEWVKFLEKYPYMSIEGWLDILDAGNGQPMIYVDESEEILRVSSLSTYSADYKIFLVWLPEKMNPEAANKLLKVIEEPFSDTLFIFVSNSAGNILPTIKSRLQSVELSALPDSVIEEYLAARGVDRDEASGLARIVRGNMNMAEQIAAKSSEMEEFSGLFIEVMRTCYARNIAEMRNLSDSFAAFGREKSMRLLAYFSRMIRESFMSNLQLDILLAMTRKERDFTVKFGPFINAKNIEQLMKTVDSAQADIGRNANQKIVWFDLMLTIMEQLRK